MKKNLLMTALLCFVCLAANAQKFALIDMEYILKNIPTYERANEQLNQISKKWQSEVEAHCYFYNSQDFAWSSWWCYYAW